MSNIYTQLHIYMVFAVKYRQAVIDVECKGQLNSYITSLVQGQQA